MSKVAQLIGFKGKVRTIDEITAPIAKIVEELEQFADDQHDLADLNDEEAKRLRLEAQKVDDESLALRRKRDEAAKLSRKYREFLTIS